MNKRVIEMHSLEELREYLSRGEAESITINIIREDNPSSGEKSA